MGRFRKPAILRKLLPWMARHSGRITTVVIALLLALVGWFAVQWRELLWPRIGDQVMEWQDMGMDQLQRYSYDTPFVFRYSLPRWLSPIAGAPRSTSEAVIIYMDEESSRRLKQDPRNPWSRLLHAKLLDRLTAEGARAVMFDLVFDTESADDAEFAAALSRNGKAYLGLTFTTNNPVSFPMEGAPRVGLAAEQLTPRNRVLYKAARSWGLLWFLRDQDNGIRRLYPGKRRDGLDPWPSAPWRMAQDLGAPLPMDDDTRFSRRWLNYYGPTRQQIESISYHWALSEEGDIPEGFFKDKVVFIGARSELNSMATQLDMFRTPWTRQLMPGVEIHATAFLNLMHGDWLVRMSPRLEPWGAALFGLLLGLLRLLRPWRAVIAAVLLAALVFLAACLVQWHARVWFNWAVLVMLQIPLALVLSVAAWYYIEERQKRQIRSAFSLYLSPELAMEIAEQNISLVPGGKKVVATMIFTDLAGYTTLAEKLGDSALLGQELVRYFTRTTDEILAEQGTVIKFIGDAVFAAWGDPVPQKDHAERAVRAAWRVAQVSEMTVSIPQPDGTTAEVPIHTRIGIHTGEVLAGNLGSERRFDYTLIGDAVNFAARLEGANKYTGTGILLSDDTARLLGGKFLLRKLGAFLVKGKEKSVVIHELLGVESAARPGWLDTFEAALTAWTAGDLETARAGFESVKRQREGEDGPSQFYLERIVYAKVGAGWTGEVALEGK